jgi:hypothetical protein
VDLMNRTPSPSSGGCDRKLLLFFCGLLPFDGRVHFLVHSWSSNCYLEFQTAVLVAIRAA